MVTGYVRCTLRCALLLTAAALAFAGRPARAAEQAGALTISVSASPHDLDAWPVEMGIPFPQGSLKSVEHVCLFREGKEVPFQAEKLASWPDGSVKDILLIFVGPLSSAKDIIYELRYGEGTRATPASGLAVTVKEGADALHVDNGRLSFDVGKLRWSLFKSAAVGGKRISEGGADLFLLDAEGNAFTASAGGPGYSVTVEDKGPVRATLRIRGRYGSARAAYLRYDVRVYVYAGVPFVKCSHTMRETEPDVWVKASGWGIEFPVDGGRSHTFGVTDAEVLSGTGDSHLFQGGGSGSKLADGKKKAELGGQRFLVMVDGAEKTDKAPGWATLSGTGGTLLAVTRDFWQQYPQELSVQGRSLKIWLHSPRGEQPFIGKPGTSKTHELLLGFYPGDLAATSAQQAASVFHARPLGRAPAQWYCSSGVFGPLLPRDDAFSKGYNRVTDFFLARLIGSMPADASNWTLYGNSGWGDRVGFGSSITWSNLPNEMPRGMLIEYLRGSSREWFDLAERACRHFMDIDVERPSGMRRISRSNLIWNTNKPYFKREIDVALPADVHQHDLALKTVLTRIWATGQAGDEPAPGGLYEYYMLTGDPRALEVLEESARSFLPMQFRFDPAAYREYPLDQYHTVEHVCLVPGWAAWTLLAAYEATGKEVYLAKTKEIVQYFIDWWRYPVEKRNNPAWNGVHLDRPAHGHWLARGDHSYNPYFEWPVFESILRFKRLDKSLREGDFSDAILDKMLIDCMDSSMTGLRKRDTECCGYAQLRFHAMSEVAQFPDVSEEMRREIEGFILRWTNGNWVYRSWPPKDPATSYRVVFSGAPFVEKAPGVERKPTLVYGWVYDCLWYEAGAEEFLSTKPYFLASFRRYAERFLNPRLVEGRLEYDFTIPAWSGAAPKSLSQ